MSFVICAWWLLLDRFILWRFDSCFRFGLGIACLVVVRSEFGIYNVVRLSFLGLGLDWFVLAVCCFCVWFVLYGLFFEFALVFVVYGLLCFAF